MRRKFLAGSLLILCFAFGIIAQERTGNIYGVVTDAQGSPLPGTKLSLTGSRIARMDALASEIGSFRFISVPPGEDYRLTAELQGFKKVVRENIVVRVGVNVDLKVMMEQGVLEEQVTVVAKTPVIDTKKRRSRTT